MGPRVFDGVTTTFEMEDRMFNNRANLATLPLTTRISDEFSTYIARSTFWTGTASHASWRRRTV